MRRFLLAAFASALVAGLTLVAALPVLADSVGPGVTR